MAHDGACISSPSSATDPRILTCLQILFPNLKEVALQHLRIGQKAEISGTCMRDCFGKAGHGSMRVNTHYLHAGIDSQGARRCDCALAMVLQLPKITRSTRETRPTQSKSTLAALCSIRSFYTSPTRRVILTHTHMHVREFPLLAANAGLHN